VSAHALRLRGLSLVLGVCGSIGFHAELGLSLERIALGQEPAAKSAVSSAPPVLLSTHAGQLAVSGYAELFYQWNANRPPSGITNYRGFDTRHNSFTVSNAVLSARYDHSGLSARLAFQVGHTPNTYYLAEPESDASQSPSAVGSSGASTWRFVQQALVGYTIPVGRGLLIEGGVFLSPIGLETLAVKDNWNFSRSHLFFQLPFYHTGLRAEQRLFKAWKLTLGVVNGWNSVVDGNDEKSVYVQTTYDKSGSVSASFLYFTGIERAPAQPSRDWRHLFDLWMTVQPSSRFEFALHGNAGVEPVADDKAFWLAGAAYVCVHVLPVFHLAARGDVFWERKGVLPSGEPLPIFFAPSDMSWLSSATATVSMDVLPGLLLRLEYRHDHSDGAVFFAKNTASTPMAPPEITQTSQNTLTAGAVASF